MKSWLISGMLLVGMLAGPISIASNDVHMSTHRTQPIVIGHRGASGYVPEHTLTSYFIAIQQGADYIEPDLVSTKDGVLIARHENEIGGTTNVAAHPEFANRKTSKIIDGVAETGWFTEDFTLAEIKTLRARERLPQLRPGNTRFDDQFDIPSFDEILSLVHAMNAERNAAAEHRGSAHPNPIGIYVETKHPTYFDGLGLSLEAPLLRSLERAGYRNRNAPVFIQSFEVGNLKQLRAKTELRLIQLIDANGAPYDLVKAGDSRTYAAMVTPTGLQQVAQYADGVGVNKDLIIPRDADQSLGAPTALVADAHAQGLLVHAWTLRAENSFLPLEYRLSTTSNDLGNVQGEMLKYLTAGIDGFFTDQPILGVDARDYFVTSDRQRSPAIIDTTVR